MKTYKQQINFTRLQSTVRQFVIWFNQFNIIDKIGWKKVASVIQI